MALRKDTHLLFWLRYGVATTALTLVLLELICRAVVSARASRQGEDWVRATAARRVFAHDPWARGLLEEERSRIFPLRSRYEPFTVWGNRSWNGKYIHAESGEGGSWRKTFDAARCERGHPRQVWIFGGSAVWGFGSPDWGTLPSALSRELNREAKDCFKVSNFGVEGFVSNQEVLLLIRLLKMGKKPDLAIFYDGANDTFSGAYSPALAEAHLSLMQIKQAVEGSGKRLPSEQRPLRSVAEASYFLSLLKTWLNEAYRRARVLAVGPNGKTVPSALTPEYLRRKSKETLDNYEANLRLLRALGKSYGFESCIFWQPAEAYPPGSSRSSDVDRAVAAVYMEAKRRAVRAHFFFLGDLFAEDREEAFIDWVHVGHRGNSIIAHAIAGDLSRCAKLIAYPRG